MTKYNRYMICDFKISNLIQNTKTKLKKKIKKKFFFQKKKTSKKNQNFFFWKNEKKWKK